MNYGHVISFRVLSSESVCETWKWPRVGPRWGSGGGFDKVYVTG